MGGKWSGNGSTSHMGGGSGRLGGPPVRGRWSRSRASARAGPRGPGPHPVRGNRARPSPRATSELTYLGEGPTIRSLSRVRGRETGASTARPESRVCLGRKTASRPVSSLLKWRGTTFPASSWGGKFRRTRVQESCRENNFRSFWCVESCYFSFFLCVPRSYWTQLLRGGLPRIRYYEVRIEFGPFIPHIAGVHFVP